MLADDTRPAPADPYGVSKLEAEAVVRALADAAGSMPQSCASR